MFKTRILKKAILFAKERAASREGDITRSSRSLNFIGNNGDSPVSMMLKDREVMVCGMALPQLCKLYEVPPPWVGAKKKLEDRVHLAECFIRHAGMLENRPLVLRLGQSTPEAGFSFAVFPETTTHIDILPMLRMVRDNLSDVIEGWSFIHITNHTLRMFGRFKMKQMRDIMPGAYLSTSEDGSFGIKVGVGVQYAHPEMTDDPCVCLMDYGQFATQSFKRVESEEGDLKRRFLAALERVKQSRIPVLKEARERCALLDNTAVRGNLTRLIELGRKSLTYPKSVDNLLLGAFTGTSLLGYWTSLLRVAYTQALEGQFQTSHQLMRAAGVLLSGEQGLALALSEASR